MSTFSRRQILSSATGAVAAVAVTAVPALAALPAGPITLADLAGDEREFLRQLRRMTPQMRKALVDIIDYFAKAEARS